MESRYYDSLETAPRAEIERLQERKLLSQLADVVPQQPLLRDLWQKAGVTMSDIRSVADFQTRAPFMDKDMIRAWRDEHDDPFGGILACDPTELSSLGSSSGTTGDATLFAYRRQVPGSWIFHSGQLWELGLRPGDFAVDLTMSTRGIGYEMYTKMGAIPLLVDHDPGDLLRLIELSRKYRPKMLFMISSPLLIALEQLEGDGVDIAEAFSSYEAVIFGGEPLSTRLKSVCARWKMPIYQMSSLGDSGTGFECRERDGFHVYDDLALAEIIDPETGAPLGDGERGELVVTNLSDKTAPLIRYRTGDLVRLTREPCACGRTQSRYWVLGRAGDELVIDGRSVIPIDIWSAVETIEECSAGLFQIIRPHRSVDVLRLRVGHRNATNLQELEQRVSAAVEASLGIRPEVELVPNAELLKLGPPHKIPRVAKK